MFIFALLITCGVVFVNLFLGFFVYKSNKRSATNKLFGLLSLVLSIWLLVFFISSESILLDHSLTFIRGSLFFATIMNALFFIFSLTMPRIQFRFKLVWFVPFFVVTFLVMLLTLSPYTFESVEIVNGSASPVPGPAIAFFGLYSIAINVGAVLILFRRIRHSKGIQKQQFRFVMLGILLMFGFIIFTIFLPVALFQMNSFVSFAPLYTLVFLGFTAYAIVRYRLMDIRVIISRSIVYAVLVSAVAGAFALITFVGSTFFTEVSGLGQLGVLAITSIIIVTLLDPLKRFLGRATNKIFFHAAINYPMVTKHLTDVINEEVELSDLVQRFTTEIEEQLRIKESTILLPVGRNIFMDPDELNHHKEHNKRIRKKKNSVYHDSPLIKYLMKTQEITILDELDRKVADSETTRERNTYDRVRKNMEDIEAQVTVPIVTKKEVEAILILTRKKSGEAYSINDIQLLEVIAPQMASGIQKARLYQEAREFNTKLEREVEKATEKLRTANEKLTKLDKAKSEFMSIASHQLRTPLAGIIGYLDMLEDGDYGETNEEQKPVIHDVLQASQRLARLVNVFLNVTRIEAGRFVMNYTTMPFHEIMESMYKELKPTADMKGVKLMYKKKKLPDVEVDQDKIKDVLLNLTDNAIKYTPEGKVTISAEATKRTVHVQVTDTGVGIEPEEAKNLFNKFVRGSDIAKVSPNGSGLGLFIAKKIVEGHGGKVWATSKGKGKGSTFHFEIPIKADKESRKKTEEFQNRAKGK